MERETGVEPATSSLGSWRSTAELLPRRFQGYHCDELRAMWLLDGLDRGERDGAAVGQLHDGDGCQHKNYAYGLQGAHEFAQGNGRDHDGEYGLQATDHDGAGRLQMLQSGKVKGEGSQHGYEREQQQKEPLGGGIMGGDEFPGRIDQKPEQRRAAGRVQQNDPAVAAGQNVVTADVVKGEGKGRQQGGEQANRIEPQSAATKQANHQSNSCHRQTDRRDLLQGGFLQPA